MTTDGPIFHKFNVTRTDGSGEPGGKHHGCDYFVLDTTHDPFAFQALSAYAGACEGTHPKLADDICELYGCVRTPAEVIGVQQALNNPATQVFFRAGLLAAREYLARLFEADSPHLAGTLRQLWFPTVGDDVGPPRKLDWKELTEGEYGTESFRVKSKDEVSPSLEALPVSAEFLERVAAAATPVEADDNG